MTVMKKTVEVTQTAVIVRIAVIYTPQEEVGVEKEDNGGVDDPDQIRDQTQISLKTVQKNDSQELKLSSRRPNQRCQRTKVQRVNKKRGLIEKERSELAKNKQKNQSLKERTTKRKMTRRRVPFFDLIFIYICSTQT